MNDDERQTSRRTNGVNAQALPQPRTLERTKWDAPLAQRIPSLLYFAGSLIFGALVLAAYMSPHATAVFAWIVDGDKQRPVTGPVVAVVVIVSAIGTIARAQMRGVVMSERWLEARYLLPGGMPRSRRWAWQQIDRIVVGRYEIRLELPTGHSLPLPEVADRKGLIAALEQVGRVHRFDVEWLE